MSNPKLMVMADKPDALYKTGEHIGFTISAPGLLPKQKIDVEYEIQFNRSETIKTGTVVLTRHDLEIDVVAGKPGFLNISVRNGDSKAEAAAGVEPHKIRPSMPCPRDFKKFWDGKKAALAAIPINPRLKQIPAITEAAYGDWNSKWPFFGKTPFKNQSITAFEVEADTLVGNPVRGFFARPSGAASKSLPALLYTHGAGVGDSDFPKACVGAKYGFLSMDINAHGLPMRQPAEYYKEVGQKITAKYGGYFKWGRLERNASYFTNMYLRHLRALDFLCSQPEWD